MADLGFGAGGVSEGQRDIQAQQLSQMTLATEGVKLESARMDLQSQQKMLALLSQSDIGQGGSGPGSPPPDPTQKSYALSNSTMTLANFAMASGQPEKARQYANAASTISKNASEIQTKQIEGTMKKLQVFGSVMDGVHDEQSWQQANAMYQLETGEQSPYGKIPYNAMFVQKLQAGITTAKDRALTEAAKARTAATEAEEAERKARVPLLKAQTRLASDRADILEKNGSVALIPKAGDLKMITDMVAKQFGASVSGEDARVRSRQAVDRMLDLVKNSHMDRNAAANQAFQEALKRGDFGGLRKRPDMMGSEAKPLPIPESADKMKANMFYAGKGKYVGKTLLWTGSEFVEAGKGPGQVEEDSEGHRIPEDEEEDTE